MDFKQIEYQELNARQQENYNFAKLAATLADYGFSALRLSDDWQGADLIAIHIDGATYLKVQLKGRLTFDKKYLGKSIWIAFRTAGSWYLYDHDTWLEEIARKHIENSKAWREDGEYSWWPKPPGWASALLDKCRLAPR
jgi:frataxin-like iron-binding protein CyaY